MKNITTDRITPLGKFVREQLSMAAKGPVVKVGFPVKIFGKAHEDLDGKKSPLTVGEIAAVQEFGTRDGRVPERSYLRSTFDEKRQAWRAKTRALLLDIAAGKMTVKQALSRMGTIQKAAYQAKIQSNIPPPNAPETVKRKGSSMTLIAKGQMVQSVHYEYKENGASQE